MSRMRPPAQDQRKTAATDRQGHDGDLDGGQPIAREPGDEEIELGADQRCDTSGRARRDGEGRGEAFAFDQRRAPFGDDALRRSEGKPAGRELAGMAQKAERHEQRYGKRARARRSPPPWTSAPIRSAASQACPIHSNAEAEASEPASVIGRRLVRSNPSSTRRAGSGCFVAVIERGRGVETSERQYMSRRWARDTALAANAPSRAARGASAAFARRP